MLLDGVFDGGGELLDLSDEGLEHGHQRPHQQAPWPRTRLRPRGRQGARAAAPGVERRGDGRSRLAGEEGTEAFLAEVLGTLAEWGSG